MWANACISVLHISQWRMGATVGSRKAEAEAAGEEAAEAGAGGGGGARLEEREATRKEDPQKTTASRPHHLLHVIFALISPGSAPSTSLICASRLAIMLSSNHASRVSASSDAAASSVGANFK